ncbi:GNAT family N-acetyltransferase [Rhizobium sp. XQZ8]|uniref:GNAT family N-acetyltransferase n=1 Tax=Rhizobium populisoli TaxID=2859785 RepID=UPI001C66DBEE|nr:GNAT family N-acetyltransferase [Rhizobium populisoli]MBW6423280.1 GNAT family N-acetyltransferase [Rhizobium populisoli]
MTVLRRRLSECSLEDAAAGFTEGFSGYVMPMNVTPHSIELRIERDHVDLDESLVFFDGDKPAGILMINRRGATTRIGAIGVGPTIRGQGFGRSVMLETIEKARARGDEKLILEVINSNIRARDLYLSLGFEISKKLVGFGRSRKRPVPYVAPPPECDLAEAARMARVFSDTGLSWQTDPRSFERVGPTLKGFAIDGKAVAILDDTGKGVRLFSLAVDPAHRRKGLGRAMADGLAARYPGQKLFFVANVPAGLLDRFMRRLDWRKEKITQSEMVFTFR